MVSASLPEVPVLIYDLQPAPGSCPFAQRSKVVLKEKGIPHKVQLIDPDNKPQEFLDLFRSITSNPKGRGTVPTIVDGDVKLTESHVVSEYLDTAYPHAGPKLFPIDAKNLAKVKLFVELYTAEVQPSAFKILTADSQEAVDTAKEGYTHGLTILDSYLKENAVEGGDFLLGKEFSYAEAATIPFVYRFNLALPHYRDVDAIKIISENKLDRLEKWIKAGVARPSIKETTLDDESLLKGFSKFVKPFK